MQMAATTAEPESAEDESEEGNRRREILHLLRELERGY